MFGYRYVDRGESRQSVPLWPPEYAGQDLQQRVIGFRDLIELRFVQAFVDHGVSLTVIRAAAAAAREQLNLDYPFASQKFRTDGKRIFGEAIDELGDVKLIDMAKRQFVFSHIITPSLYGGLEYEGDQVRRWFPLGKGKENRQVVVDPAHQFGQPMLLEAGIPTDTIYSSYLAEGGDKRAVSRLFDVSVKSIEAAIRFELHLAA
jgi:uncharacterized protein (DUF433 family)